MERPFEFTELIEPDELESLVANLAGCIDMASGIVCQREVESLKIIAEYKKYLADEKPDPCVLKAIIEKLPPPEDGRITCVYNQSRFCEMVRRSELGNLRCAYSDTEHGIESFKKRRHLVYRCHAGLKDIVAPILIGNRHAANIYIGQIYAPLSKDIEVLYNELGLINKGIELDDFKKAYRSLRQVSDERMERIGSFLFQLAKHISLYVTTRASTRVFSDIEYKLSLEDDVRPQFRMCLENAKRIINFRNGIIWIQDHRDPDKLNLLVADPVEGDDFEAEYIEGIPKGLGLAGKVFETGEPLRLNTAEEIRKIPPYKDGPRVKREPKSVLRVPLKRGSDIIGVLSVEDGKEYAFWPDDVRVLEETARHISHHITSVQQLSGFVADILSPENRQSLMARIVKIIPDMVGGIGCSIFLRDKPGEGPAHCVATTGLVGIERGKESSVVYIPGEGLTGWVLKNGETLNLEIHQDIETRRDVVKKIAPDLRWTSKHRANVFGPTGEPISDDDFARMPFLAVPIRGIDQKVIGVLRIPGRLLPGNFSVEDQKLIEGVARLIADLMTDQQIGPVKLLHLLWISSEMQDETDFQRLAYTFLTLLTHSQGLGINRAMLFEYDEYFMQLCGLMTIGPGDIKEAQDFRAELRNVAPLQDCIDNFQEVIGTIVSSKLSSKVEEFINLDPPCKILEVIEKGELSVSHLFPEREPISEDLQGLFGEIGVKHPTLVVLPVHGEKVYVVICDDVYRDAELDSDTLKFLESFGWQMLRALRHLRHEERVAAAKQEAWRETARMAAHNLSNKLPFVYDMILEASECPDPLHNEEFWEKVLEIISGAQTIVNGLQRLQLVVNANQVVSCRKLLGQIGSHLNYIEGKIKLVIDYASCPDLRLCVDAHAVLECFDMLAHNSIENGAKDIEIRMTFVDAASEENERYGLGPRRRFVSLYFTDSGSGIPKGLKKRIFDPDFSTKPKPSGGGLGLAFVKHVVTSHGGMVIEDGEYGQGARFQILLPVNEEE